jgi:DMSO/TMAO reductase YedYZ molybdopterin-dependent catalytic subunit
MTTSERPTTTAAERTAAESRAWAPGIAAAALVGLIAMGQAVGIAELLAAIGGWIGVFHPTASPLSSLGQTFIQFTPEWLKEFAIRTFGEYDKTALTAGMGITLFLVALVIGIIARRSPRIAVGITAALILVTAAAVFSRTGSTIVDVIPILLGGAAGIYLLVTAFRQQVVTTPAATENPDDDLVQRPAQADDSAVGANPKPALTGANHPMAGIAANGVGRRAFFKIAGLGALVAVGAAALGKWIPSGADVAASRAGVALPTPADIQQLTVAPLQVDGITPFVTNNADFYRVDTAFVVPQLTTDTWELKVHGLVGSEVTLSFADLIAMPSVERMITLTCVSNEVGGDLAGNAVWQGVRIADLLKQVAPQAGADCVLSTSVDGFTVTTPLEALTDGRDAILAYAMNGEPLPTEHGFPVRMVVPGLYGYVSATKWVVDLKVTKFADETAYWTSRGWSAQAPIKTASRIDVPKSFAQLPKGTVAVAGMAWAQHRGISGVQVQIDDDGWQDATLSGDLTTDIWRQWSYPWDTTSAPGLHTIRCRAVDGTGAVQTDQVQAVMPDGSSGWDSRSVTVMG